MGTFTSGNIYESGTFTVSSISNDCSDSVQVTGVTYNNIALSTSDWWYNTSTGTLKITNVPDEKDYKSVDLIDKDLFK